MAELTMARIIEALRNAQAAGAPEPFMISGGFAGRVADVLEAHASKLEQRDREYSDLSQLCHLKLGEIKTLEGRLDEMTTCRDECERQFQEKVAELGREIDRANEAEGRLNEVLADRSTAREHLQRERDRADEAESRLSTIRSLMVEWGHALHCSAEGVRPTSEVCDCHYGKIIEALDGRAVEKCERCEGTGIVGEYYPGGKNYPCPDCAVETRGTNSDDAA